MNFAEFWNFPINFCEFMIFRRRGVVGIVPALQHGGQVRFPAESEILI